MDDDRDSHRDREAGVPETSLRDWIAGHAGRFPDKPFIESIDQGRAITYGELRTVCDRMAQYLRARPNNWGGYRLIRPDTPEIATTKQADRPAAAAWDRPTN